MMKETTNTIKLEIKMKNEREFLHCAKAYFWKTKNKTTFLKKSFWDQ